MIKPPRKGFITALKVAVTVTLIAVILSRISLGEAWILISTASLPWLLGALLLFTLSVVAGAWQWGLFLGTQGIGPLSLRLFRFYWIGLFFNNFMPGNVGGDLVKVVDLSRDQNDPVAATTATLADRISGFTALALLTLVAAWQLSGEESLRGLTTPLMVGGSLLMLVAVLFLLDPVARLFRRLGEMVGLFAGDGLRHRVLEQLRVLRQHRLMLLRLFLLALGVQILRVMVHYFVGRALIGDACPPLFQFFLVIPPLAYALTLPVTLGGLGLREGLAIPLFALLGVSGEAAVAVELLAYLLMLLVSLYGGLLFLTRRGSQG